MEVKQGGEEGSGVEEKEEEGVGEGGGGRW